jgi:hypothetical protein
LPLTRDKTRASALFITLVVVSIVVMFVTALVGVNQNLFGFAKRTNDRAAALALAKGGLNRLIDRLTYQDTFASDLNFGTPQTGYSITFNSANLNHSVNNLTSDAISATANYQGDAVPPHTADIIVVARSNGVERRFRFILKRGLAFQGAMAANRRIRFGQDIELDSITSLNDNQPVETRFHANDYGNDGTGVTWDAGGAFVVGPGCEVSSASSVQATITAVLTPDDVSQDVPAIPVPSLDIDQIVSDNSSAPAPTLLPVGDYHCDDNRYLSTSTTVVGNISLYDGSLYVQGDLNIVGGVVGYGSIYVTGDVNITGGNASVVTNQPNGAAILAGGDINFTALSAEGFIDELALTDTDVANAWTQFKDAFATLDAIVDVGNDGFYSRPTGLITSTLHDMADTPYGSFPPGEEYGNPSSPYIRADDIHWAVFHLGRGITNSNIPALVETDPQPISLPGPEPVLPPHSPAFNISTMNERSFTRILKDAVESAAPSDIRTPQIDRALNHVAFYSRHNYWDNDPNNPPAGNWDDESLSGDPALLSLDRQLWIVHGMGGSAGNGPFGIPFTPDDMANGVREYFEHHDPFDFGWLGKAYFQGLLYAKGDITIVNRTEVIGMIISGGDLSVLDGAKFTYNKEYDELTQNLSGPVRVVSFREL